MIRTAATLGLAAVLLIMPGCQIINTLLQLAPTALLFLEAPEAVEVAPQDTETAALPLEDALRLGLDAGASGQAYLVPAGETPPAAATAPTRPGLQVCALPVADTGVTPELTERMADSGLTLVRVTAR